MDLTEEYSAVLPDPTFSRSMQASFESNVVGSTLLMGMDAISALGNKEPVTDQQIEARVKQDNLQPYLHQFVDIKTQGELDTKVERINRQIMNKKIGEIGGWQGFSTDLVAGVLDAPTFLPFGAAIKGVSTARATARVAGAAVVDAAVTEAATSQTLSETYSPFEGVTRIAGSAVIGAVLGAGAGKLLNRGAADKMGAGLVKESDDVLTGAMAKHADDLQAAVAKATDDIQNGRFEVAPIPARKYADGYTEHTLPDGTKRTGFVMYHASPNAIDKIDTTLTKSRENGEGFFVGSREHASAFARGEDPVMHSVFVDATPDQIVHLDRRASEQATPKLTEFLLGLGYGDRSAVHILKATALKQGKSVRDVLLDNGFAGVEKYVGQGRRETFIYEGGRLQLLDREKFRAQPKQPETIAPKVDAEAVVPKAIEDHPLYKEVDKLTGAPPTASQIALASTLGMEAFTRYGSRLYGASIPMEMIASKSNAARQFAADFFMLRGTLDNGIVAPESIMGLKGVITGLQGTAKDALITGWREWSREAMGGRLAGVVGRMTSEKASLEAFSDLVFRAAALGDDAVSKEAGTALSNPIVQNAAKAYRDFDKALFEREVKAGLIGRDAAEENHVRHIYDTTRLLSDKEQFVSRETEHAFQSRWNTIKTEAAARRDKAFADASSDRETLIKRIRDNQQKDIPKLQALAEARVWREYDKEVASMNRTADMRERRDLRNLKANFDAQEREAMARLKAEAEAKFPGKPDAQSQWLDAATDKVLTKLEDAHESKRLSVVERVDRHREEKEAELFAAYDKKVQPAIQDALGKRSEEVRKAVLSATEKADKETSAASKLYKKETSKQVVDDLREWAKSHAEGVHNAIVHGRRAIIDPISASDRITGGNVRGGRKARNVYTPTHELLANNWLDTDILKAIDKQTRQDGMDAILAKKFRRPMTEAESKLLEKGSPDAYWRHGDDPNSVPDLDLSVVRTRIKDEFKSKIDATQDVVEQKALSREMDAMLGYVEDAVSGARGLDGSDSVSAKLANRLALAKAVNFSLYMGGSLLTNTVDAQRVLTYHALGTSFQYFAMRMGQKFRTGALFDAASEENREMAHAAGLALNHVNFGRTALAMGIGDPYASSTKDTRPQAVATWLTRTGGHLFGINWWNNKTQEIGYALAQFRLAKLATGDGKLAARDSEWLQYIGIDADTLGQLKGALAAQGLTKVTGNNSSVINHRLFDTALQDRFISALQKDVTTMIVTPDHATLPRAFSNPVLSAVLQFQSYALEASQAVTMRDAQRLRSGDSGAVVQGIFALMAGSLLAYYMQGVSRSVYDLATGKKSGQTDLDKRVQAWTDTPAQLFYQTFDYSGLVPMITNTNNFIEGFTGVGIKELAKEFDGGRRLGAGSTRTNFSPNFMERAANAAGPTMRTLATAGKVGGDLMTGQFTEQTASDALKLTPFASTFYLRNALESGLGGDVLGPAMELQKKSDRSRPLQRFFGE